MSILRVHSHPKLLMTTYDIPYRITALSNDSSVLVGEMVTKLQAEVEPETMAY
jgi:hypothetical protein